MSPAPTPASPPSSPGSGNLEIDVAPSPRLLLYLGAWSAAALAAVLDCAACGPVGRAGLLAATAAALVSGALRLLPWPGRGAICGLRRHADGWQAHFGAAWVDVAVLRAVEILRGGWWLQLHCRTTARSHWVWIDAERTPRTAYRALCRALCRALRARDAFRTTRAAGRTNGAVDTAALRRASHPRARSRR